MIELHIWLSMPRVKQELGCGVLHTNTTYIHLLLFDYVYYILGSCAVVFRSIIENVNFLRIGHSMFNGRRWCCVVVEKMTFIDSVRKLEGESGEYTSKKANRLLWLFKCECARQNL